eukprot:6348234-Lingulodinium_polyedra.AAC.1
MLSWRVARPTPRGCEAPGRRRGSRAARRNGALRKPCFSDDREGNRLSHGSRAHVRARNRRGRGRPPRWTPSGCCSRRAAGRG